RSALPPRSPPFPYTTLFRSCGFELAHRHEEAAVADDQHRRCGGATLRHAQRRAEAETDRCELTRHLQMAGGGDGEIRQDAEEIRSEEHTSELQSLTNIVCRL